MKMPPGVVARLASPPVAERLALRGRERAGTLAMLAGAVVVLWLATRPYEGVVHDSKYYTLLASRLANPARFASDLFLQFGSQDRFTVFSYLYAPILARFGVSAGAMLLTVVAQALWLAAAFVLARSLLRDSTKALVAVAGLVALPSSYGPEFIFSFGEGFVTPRLFAEAMTMVALSLLVQGRQGTAALAMVGAGAFHPVMALPGAAAVLVYAGRANRLIWVGAGCAAAASLALASCGVEPFARLGVQLDPDWFESVHFRVSAAFLARWSLVDHLVLASDVLLALASLRVLRAESRRLTLTVLAVALGGLGLTLVGADALHNQLLVNLQFWRAAWLLGVLVHLMAVPFLLLPGKDDAAVTPVMKPFALAAVFFLFISRFCPLFYIYSTAFLAVVAVFKPRWDRLADAPQRVSALWLAIMVVAGGAAAYLIISFTWSLPLPASQRWARLQNLGLCVLALGLIASVLLTTRSRFRTLSAVTIVTLLVAAASGWDQRPAWARFVEAGDSPDGLASFIPEKANVYWGDSVDLLWFHLKHSSYYSCMQGSGIMFFKGTDAAFEYRRESFRFEPVQANFCRRLNDAAPTQISGLELRRACVREPQLDYIIIPDRVPGAAAQEWRSPVTHWVPHLSDGKAILQKVDWYYRYSCADLRSAEASEQAADP